MASETFEPVFKYEPGFKENKLQSRCWEIKTANHERIKIYVPKFVRTLIELIIHCMTTAIREFKIIGILPRRWREEYGKTLSGSAHKNYTRLLGLNMYPHKEAGFKMFIRDFILTYQHDANARKTQIKAFEGANWKFVTQEKLGVKDHVDQVREKFEDTEYLTGTHPLREDNLKDVVFGTFPQKWTENLLMKGTTSYARSTIKEIVAYMKLEHGRTKYRQLCNKQQKEDKKKRKTQSEQDNKNN